MGYTGLKQFGGRIAEEFLRKLQGDKAAKVFREMSENDSTVGAILFAIEMMLRNVEWRVEPASDDPMHVEEAEFVDECRADMSQSWENTIAEILSFLTYGWSSTEICYKRRDGPDQRDPRRRSKQLRRQADPSVHETGPRRQAARATCAARAKPPRPRHGPVSSVCGPPAPGRPPAFRWLEPGNDRSRGIPRRQGSGECRRAPPVPSSPG